MQGTMNVPVTDGNQKVSRCWGEKLKVGYIQLFDLYRLTELYYEPEEKELLIKKKAFWTAKLS